MPKALKNLLTSTTNKNISFYRLTEHHIIKPFECGNPDLNAFLFDDAKLNEKSLMAVTYIIENLKQTLAYYTLQNDKITYYFKGSTAYTSKGNGLGGQDVEDSGYFKSYPAVKIARLAVSRQYQKRGLGRYILDCTKKDFKINNKTGCKFLTVDAYRGSIEFYRKNGFNFLSSKDADKETRLMYFNLESI